MKNDLLLQEIEAAANYIIKQTSDGFVHLTQDNVARVEAMIMTNSSYRRSGDADSKIVYKIPRGKTENEKEISYNGSSAFWFSKLKEMFDQDTDSVTISEIKCSTLRISQTYTFADIIKHCVIAVDSENSTHLNSDKDTDNDFSGSRKAVAERITQFGIQKLFDSLSTPNDYSIISIIQGEDSNGNKLDEYKNERNHFSFATKFCNEACMYLADEVNAIDPDRFSKYDTILENELPRYCQKYINREPDLKTQKDGLSQKGHSAELYKQYSDYIKQILDIAASENGGIRISRRGFDHLLWYTYKGD